MDRIILFNENDLERLTTEIIEKLETVLQEAESPAKWMKSAEVREFLGGISPAKLQSLRINGHIPAVNADGLWLYNSKDVSDYLNSNKSEGKERYDE